VLDFKFIFNYKLRKKADFDFVLKERKRIFSDDFIFFYRANALGYPRLGVLINKKNCRLAVTRNCLRRKIRELFRLQQQTLSGFDLVVMLQSPTDKTLIRDRFSCLKKMFSALEIQCRKSALL